MTDPADNLMNIAVNVINIVPSSEQAEDNTENTTSSLQERIGTKQSY